MKYKIIEGHKEQVEKEVNALLENMWELHGATIYTGDGYKKKGNDHFGCIFYTQCLIKKQKE